MKIELGDLLVTREWDRSLSIEICQYRGATGALMYRIGGPVHLLERFVKDTDSVPYSTQRILASEATQFLQDNKDK